MADIRKVYDTELGTSSFLPELKLMQRASKPVEDELARAGDIWFQDQVVKGMSATLISWGSNRQYWPQGNQRPLCSSDDARVGVAFQADGQEKPAYGGVCAECPMFDNGCQSRVVLRMQSLDGNDFFIQAHGRNVAPAAAIVNAARSRPDDDPMVVSIDSEKGGPHDTFRYVFTAV